MRLGHPRGDDDAEQKGQPRDHGDRRSTMAVPTPSITAAMSQAGKAGRDTDREMTGKRPFAPHILLE